MAVIYQIQNKVTGKRYIGETKEKNPLSRWNQHRLNIQKGRGCPALQDAVRKYGIENFEFNIILFCFDEDRFIYEKEYIQKYNTMTPNGYNITPGGEGGGFYGKRHTQETKEKIKESHKVYRNDPEYMKRWKEAQQEGMKSVDISSCMKNSVAFKKAVEEGRVGSPAHKKTKTEEELKVIREKISQSVKKYFETNEGNKVNIEKHRDVMAKVKGVPVAQYDLSGNLVSTYKSISEAARTLNINRNIIRMVLNNDKRAGKGFRWKTLENPV